MPVYLYQIGRTTGPWSSIETTMGRRELAIELAAGLGDGLHTVYISADDRRYKNGNPMCAIGYQIRYTSIQITTYARDKLPAIR